MASLIKKSEGCKLGRMLESSKVFQPRDDWWGEGGLAEAEPLIITWECFLALEPMNFACHYCMRSIKSSPKPLDDCVFVLLFASMACKPLCFRAFALCLLLALVDFEIFVLSAILSWLNEDALSGTGLGDSEDLLICFGGLVCND